MAERTREAEALMDEVRAQAEHMVQRTEIVRQANSVAQRILDDANEEARTLRHQAEDFVDTKLAGMEIVLDRLTRTVQAGRAQPGRPPRRGGDGRRRSRERGGRLLRPGPDLVVAANPFVVHVARLRRSGRSAHEVRRGEVALAGPLDEAGIDPGRSVVPAGAEAEADVTLHPFEGGIEVEGTVSAPWVGICRRCAEPVAGELRIHVHERFADAPLAGPSDDELYPIVDDELDLGPLVRDAIVLELPMAPLCRRRLRRPLPPVRGQPQRGRLWLRCPPGSPVG